ncbi:transcription antitermination factor NusB [soil metagenome]
MQLLFAWDANGNNDAVQATQILADGSNDEETRREALAMATGAWIQREMIDPRIERLAPAWPTRRQPGVDRNLLRLAVWELTNLPTPPKVVIDEAIELSKQFSTEQSAAFVNGVLDAIHKENQALTGQV